MHILSAQPRPPRLLPALIRPGRGPEIPWVADRLHLTLVAEDGPIGTGTPVSEGDLLTWDEPFMDLVHQAIWNLRGQTREDQLQPVAGVPGLFKVHTPDGLAASRLLCLGDLLRPWPFQGAVVGCPTPDQLWVVPLEGLRALPAMRAQLYATWRDAHRSAHRLSDQLYWIRDGHCTLLPVQNGPGGVSVRPPADFTDAIHQLTMLGLAPIVGAA